MTGSEPLHLMAEDRQWRTMLERLFRDHGALVDDFLHRLQMSGAYGDNSITDEDLRRAASDTLELLIRRLAGLPLSAELEAVPARLGIRRARQGVAREALMDAVRLDFRVIWAGLVRASGESSADLLVRYAEHVLSTVEQYSGDVQAAFLDEQAALARDSRVEINRAVARLINADGDTESVAAEVARTLRLPLNGKFEVAYVREAAADSARRVMVRSFREREYLSADLDDGTVFVRREDVAASLSSVLARHQGGLVPHVFGIIGLPAAIALARNIGGQSSPDTLAEERDVWLSILHESAVDLLPTIRSTADALASIRGEERQRLLSTVDIYCSSGSIKKTAEALFCHRNTIINRLRQIQKITGCDVTIPLQATRVLVALGSSTIRTAPTAEES